MEEALKKLISLNSWFISLQILTLVALIGGAGIFYHNLQDIKKRLANASSGASSTPNISVNAMTIRAAALFLFCASFPVTAQVTQPGTGGISGEEKRFEITGDEQAAIGSRLAIQICQPAFERDAMAVHGQELLDTYRDWLAPYGMANGALAPFTASLPLSGIPMEAQISFQRKAFQEAMRNVAAEHKEFVEALIHSTELKQQYSKSTDQHVRD
ncbi:MAG: hypothetical protein RLZZ227_2119 [Pseudomonadota bacterium]|jgi:hypothetical protein